MKINISSVHFDADTKLLEFIESKVSKLTVFADDIVSSEVHLKLDNATNAENKVCNIKLEIKGNDLFAEKQSKSFEEAVDEVVEALKKQLTKRKDKLKK